jgi:murein DD-endopeptidase MepM/ murein hydrolase activator NlpD
MRSTLVSFILLFILSACSSMKSGRYVFVEKPFEMNRVAKEYGVSVDELKLANPDKTFESGGEWLFIPTKVGIAYLLRDTYVVEDYRHLGKGKYHWPVPNFYRISSNFGPRGRRHHDGIDIPAPKGTPIVAVADGTVVYSSNGIRGYGNMIVLAHEGEVFTVYAHNKKNMVKKGANVKQGQVIGQIGSTGRSTGPHLHFEIRMKSTVRNPAQFLTRKD